MISIAVVVKNSRVTQSHTRILRRRSNFADQQHQTHCDGWLYYGSASYISSATQVHVFIIQFADDGPGPGRELIDQLPRFAPPLHLRITSSSCEGGLLGDAAPAGIEELEPAHTVQMIDTGIVDGFLEIGPVQFVAVELTPFGPEIGKKGGDNVLCVVRVVGKLLRIIPQLSAVVIVRALEQDSELFRRKAFFVFLIHGVKSLM